jgi:Xaa-Pro aminopeptidase
VKCAAVVVVVGLVLVGWTAPMYDVGKVPKNERLVRLAKDGKLGRPALVISPLNNYYLSGRRVPVAVISERASLLTRLSFPLLGQSIVRQVRAMRAVKDDVELRAMRRAAVITSSTFADIAPLIRPGVSEADIERRILMSYRDHGATGVAFTSIVGSGPNAVLPHYDKNDAIM